MMKNKWRSHSGETLVETLVAMLVIVLAVMMLTGGIVTAARINKSARDLNTSFNAGGNVEVFSNAKVKVHHNSETDTVNVTLYRTKDNNKYCYYEVP